jgi:hypothetical protein
MHNGTIFFNGVDLSLLGKPTLNIRRVPDPPAPAMPTRRIVTLTVRVALAALSPDTIAARAGIIREALMHGEGVLDYQTGQGKSETWLAIPGADGLEAALTGRTNAVEITFTATESIDDTALNGLAKATYLPFGSETAVNLLAVREIQKDIKTERHGDRTNARRVTTTTQSLTARVWMANPADGVAVRLAALQAKAAEIEAAVASKEGTLTLGGVAKVVKIMDFTPVIDDAAQTLDVRIQVSSYALPDATKAEVALKTTSRTEEGSGEEIITVTGTIEALTRIIALAKLNAIRAAQAAIEGSRITGITVDDTEIDGKDTEGEGVDGWTGALGFTIERRSALQGSHWTLKVTTSRDARNGMGWNYSGTVKSVDAATALATARAIGGSAAHPVRTKDEETVETVTAPGAAETPAEQFVQVTFSYGYEGPSDGFITAEITMDTARPRYGEWTTAISGFVVAADKATAETRLGLILSGEGTSLERSEKWTTLTLDRTGSDETPGTLFQRLDFTFTRRDTRTYASAKYTDTESSDAGTMTLTRAIAGTLWSDTAAHAETALAELFTTVFGEGNTPQRIVKTKPQEVFSGTVSLESVAGTSSFWQIDFTAERTSAAAGLDGHDIIEARYTMGRKGCINNAIVTPIPFGRPVAQADTGYLPGQITIEASCKSRLAATGRTWCQGKRDLATAIGTAGVTQFETQQPQESSSPEYAPFDGETVTLWNFSGSYGWTYTGTVLDGLWP